MYTQYLYNQPWNHTKPRDATYSESSTRHERHNDETPTSDGSRGIQSQATQIKTIQKDQRNLQIIHYTATLQSTEAKEYEMDEIEEWHRNTEEQSDNPTLQVDDTSTGEDLQYDCRINWTREGTMY